MCDRRRYLDVTRTLHGAEAGDQALRERVLEPVWRAYGVDALADSEIDICARGRCGYEVPITLDQTDVTRIVTRDPVEEDQSSGCLRAVGILALQNMAVRDGNP